MMCSPPNIVDNACLYVLEAISMSQNFYHGSSAKAMPSDGHLVDMESVLPLLPIDTLQPSGRTTNEAFTPQVLPSDLFSIPCTNLLEDIVSFL